MDTINKRIKYLYAEELNITAVKFAKEVNSPSTTIANIMSKTRKGKPSWDVIKKIATRYNGSDGKQKLSMEWLIRGDGEVWLEDKTYAEESDSNMMKVMEEKNMLYKFIISEKLPDVAKKLKLDIE